MSRFFGLLKVFRRDIIIMLIAALNKGTPSKIRALILIAILYILSPIDLLPDSVPLMGLADDMLIIPAIVYGLKRMLPQEVAKVSEEKANVMLKKGGVIVFVAALLLIFWIGLIFLAFYKLFF